MEKAKNEHIGETNRAKNGLMMTIIAYRKYDDLDIQFEDGIIVTNKQYGAFKRGDIQHPSINARVQIAKKKYLGQTYITNSGLTMEVIDYEGNDDVTILFKNTDITVKHKKMRAVKKGEIGLPLPYQVGNIIMTGLAYVIKDDVNFYCECPKCGLSDVMNMTEIRNHNCLSVEE